MTLLFGLERFFLFELQQFQVFPLLQSSNSSSTQLTDGKIESFSVWSVAFTKLDIVDKSKCSTCSVSNLGKNIVKHVNSCNTMPLGESFAKAKCLWLMSIQE